MEQFGSLLKKFFCNNLNKGFTERKLQKLHGKLEILGKLKMRFIMAPSYQLV